MRSGADSREHHRDVIVSAALVGDLDQSSFEVRRIPMSVRAETAISASLASIIVGVTIRFFSDLRISHLS